MTHEAEWPAVNETVYLRQRTGAYFKGVVQSAWVMDESGRIVIHVHRPRYSGTSHVNHARAYRPADIHPACATCGARLAWADDQWCCTGCGDEFALTAAQEAANR